MKEDPASQSAVNRHNATIRVGDAMEKVRQYAVLLETIPVLPDFLSDVETLLLVEMAEFMRVDWSAGLEVPAIFKDQAHNVRKQRPEDLARLDVIRVDTYPVWAMDAVSGRRSRVNKVVRVRPSSSLLNHSAHQGVTWIPDLDITKARLLLGQLRRENEKIVQGVLDRIR